MSRAPLLAVLVVTGFFAFINGVRAAYIVVYAIGLLLLLGAAWSWWTLRHIVFTRQAPSGPFTVGQVFEEQFTVENRSSLPLPLCEVHDESRLPGYQASRALSLGPRDRRSWGVRGRFTVRGRHTLGPTALRIGDPFGLFPRSLRVSTGSSVLVLPPVHPVPGLWAPSGRAGPESVRAGRPRDVPPNVSGVREHDPADGMNRIHWISTARRGRLMSRVFDAEEGADVLIALDLTAGVQAGTAPDSALDYAVTLAASVAHGALERGRAVALVSNGRVLTVLPAARGAAQEQRVLEHLALAQDDGRLAFDALLQRHLPPWRGRGSVVVVTCSRTSRWVEVVATSSAAGERAVAIYVDPASFDRSQPVLRVPPQWRLVLDLWIVRRGDDLGHLERLSHAAG